MGGVRKLLETDILNAKRLLPEDKARLIKQKQQLEQRQKEEEERRQVKKMEEEKRMHAQKAEDERRSKIQAMRKSSRQCVMCGQNLGFFSKLLLEDRHEKCKTFIY